MQRYPVRNRQDRTHGSDWKEGLQQVRRENFYRIYYECLQKTPKKHMLAACNAVVEAESSFFFWKITTSYAVANDLQRQKSVNSALGSTNSNCIDYKFCPAYKISLLCVAYFPECLPRYDFVKSNRKVSLIISTTFFRIGGW